MLSNVRSKVRLTIFEILRSRLWLSNTGTSRHAPRAGLQKMLLRGNARPRPPSSRGVATETGRVANTRCFFLNGCLHLAGTRTKMASSSSRTWRPPSCSPHSMAAMPDVLADHEHDVGPHRLVQGLSPHTFRLCTEIPIRHLLVMVGHHRPTQGIFFCVWQIRKELLLCSYPRARVRLQVPHHLVELKTTRPHQHYTSVDAAQWPDSASAAGGAA